jgi:hypothetical protein
MHLEVKGLRTRLCLLHVSTVLQGVLQILEHHSMQHTHHLTAPHHVEQLPLPACHTTLHPDAFLLLAVLQGVLQSLELHSIYQVEVEFTRALREAVKQLLRQYKLPEVRTVHPLGV